VLLRLKVTPSMMYISLAVNKPSADAVFVSSSSQASAEFEDAVPVTQVFGRDAAAATREHARKLADWIMRSARARSDAVGQRPT
jgi:hypothetical protein